MKAAASARWVVGGGAALEAAMVGSGARVAVGSAEDVASGVEAVVGARVTGEVGLGVTGMVGLVVIGEVALGVGIGPGAPIVQPMRVSARSNAVTGARRILTTARRLAANLVLRPSEVPRWR